MSEDTPEPAIPGFVGRPRTRRVECDWLVPEEGAEPLWAEVRSDLSLGLVRRIPFGEGHTYAELWETIAPLVVDWNCVQLDTATGAYAPVPPPSVAGPEAFSYVDPIVSDWLAFVLKTTYRSVVGDDQKKASATGPSNASAPASASSSPAKRSRPNRTGSGSSAPST